MTGVLALARPNRFEFRANGFLWVLALGFAGLVAARLAAYGIPAACFGAVQPAECVTRRTEMNAYSEFASAWTLPALVGLAIVPPLSGLVLGIAIVAKELDQRTSVLAWSLATSRLRWLTLRVLPVAIALAAAGLAAGVLGDLVQGYRTPSVEASRSFDFLGGRGIVASTTALSAFGIALVIGSLLGRILPALLVAGALVVGIWIDVYATNDAILHGEVVMVRTSELGVSGRVLDTRVLTPSGAIISLEDAYAIYGPDFEGTSSAHQVLLVNPGEIYPLAVARAAVLQGAIGLGTLALTFLVVDRRRP